MKFKRNIAMHLKENETVTVPKDEFWKYTIFNGLNDSEGRLGGSGTSILYESANACSGGGAKLRAKWDVYITGAAFTAD